MSTVLNRLRRAQKTLGLWTHVKSRYWASILNNYGVPPTGIRTSQDGRLFISQLNLSLVRSKHEFVLEGFECAIQLAKIGAIFEIDASEVLHVSIEGITVVARGKEDLFILGEIYVSGTYDFHLAGEFVLLDVGMNVGHASLYFAQRHPDCVIIGFEPLKPTYDRALANFAANPEISTRILHYNFGLAGEDNEFEVDYSDVVPALSSVYGLPLEHKTYLTTRREKLKVRDASAVFDEVNAAHPGHRVVMKIDCEGAEYGIIDRLIERGKLANVDMLMVEWHKLAPEHDPLQLRNRLSAQGFSSVIQDVASAPAGLLYSFRTAEVSTTVTA